MMGRVVEFPALSEEFGISYDRAKALRRTGQWREGIHYRKVGERKLLYDREKIASWYAACFDAGCVPATLKANQCGRGKRGSSSRKGRRTSD